MKKQTFGSMIAQLRKQRGMTQLELAEQMGVTDKAVSKWERDLSFPDVSSLPRLAEIFEVSVDDLMGVRQAGQEEAGKDPGALADTILKGISAAMGVAVAALTVLNRVEVHAALGMLGIGLACLSIAQLGKREKE